MRLLKSNLHLDILLKFCYITLCFLLAEDSIYPQIKLDKNMIFEKYILFLQPILLRYLWTLQTKLHLILNTWHSSSKKNMSDLGFLLRNSFSSIHKTPLVQWLSCSIIECWIHKISAKTLQQSFKHELKYRLTKMYDLVF